MIIKTNLYGRYDVGPSWLWGEDKTHYLFMCKCGKSFRLRKTNKYISDNQYKCPNCKRLKMLIPYIGERHVYKRIRSDAKATGRVFDISFSWFVKQCHKRCHYCGNSNQNKVTIKSQVPGEVLLKDFRYNGLDRIDNDVGYVESNCVPCCIICNRAKNSMTYVDFIHWIEDVIEYRRKMIEFL